MRFYEWDCCPIGNYDVFAILFRDEADRLALKFGTKRAYSFTFDYIEYYYVIDTKRRIITPINLPSFAFGGVYDGFPKGDRIELSPDFPFSCRFKEFTDLEEERYEPEETRGYKEEAHARSIKEGLERWVLLGVAAYLCNVPECERYDEEWLWHVFYSLLDWDPEHCGEVVHSIDPEEAQVLSARAEWLKGITAYQTKNCIIWHFLRAEGTKGKLSDSIRSGALPRLFGWLLFSLYGDDAYVEN